MRASVAACTCSEGDGRGKRGREREREKEGGGGGREVHAIVIPRVHNRKREESVALRICAVFHPWQRFTTFSWC